LRRYLDQPLTLRRLAAIEADITRFYRARHRPFVSVVAPEQDVSGGGVKIVITQYRLGTVKVAKHGWSHPGALIAGIRARPGQPIDSERLEEDLGWLNQNPFRTVDVIASAGAGPATTDLSLVAHDRRPWSVYATYANDGSDSTGLGRIKLGGTWGDLLGQQLSYQYTSSSDLFASHPPSFQAHAGSAVIRLPWRHELDIMVDYERDRPNYGPDFASVGQSWQASFRYKVPLPRIGGLVETLAAGFDYKSSNNNLDFGGQNVSAHSAEIDQFALDYDGTLPDRLGSTRLTNSLVVSPGRITAHNNDAYVAASLAANGLQTGGADYVYDRVALARATRLGRTLVWNASVTAQFASDNLLPSEQLNLGGMSGLRGYHEFVLGGSRGVEVLNQIDLAAFPVFGAPHSSTDALQPGVFVDYGHVSGFGPVVGHAPSADLASVGAHLSYRFGQHVEANAALGLPLRDVPGQTNRRLFANFALTVRY
jgi:hemolysin activation/secretion protein